MTRNTTARIAGGTFLFYIALGIASMVFSARSRSGATIAAKLSLASTHVGDVRLSILLSFLCCFCAIILGVTLYAITRDEDRDIAMIGLACRIAEAVIGAAAAPASLAFLWLATSQGTGGVDVASASPVVDVLLKMESYSPIIGAALFAVGSLMFSYLFVRGRMIPAALAWLGVFASLLLVLALPLQLVGYIGRPFVDWMWAPMALFEIPLGLYFLVKGVRPYRSDRGE